MNVAQRTTTTGIERIEGDLTSEGKKIQIMFFDNGTTCQIVRTSS